MNKYTYLIILFKVGISAEEADKYFINKGMSATEHDDAYSEVVARRTRVPFKEWQTHAIEFLNADEVKFVGIGYHTK